MGCGAGEKRGRFVGLVSQIRMELVVKKSITRI